MKSTRWLVIPTIAMALSVLAARGAPDAGTTVGDFAFKISHAMGQRPADVAAAAQSLRKAGVDLGKDIGASLTWGRATGILQDLGLRVTPPKEPAGQVSSAKAAGIVSIVAMSHGTGQSGSGHGHGHGDDCPPSPSNPHDCDDDHEHDGDHDHGGDNGNGHGDNQGDNHGDDHGDGHGDSHDGKGHGGG